MQRRLLGIVRCIDVGTKIKQQLDHIHLRGIVAGPADGLVQGSPSLLILIFGRGVCTVFQQQPDNVDAAPHDSEMERRETAVARWPRWPVFQQQPDGRGLRCHEQGGGEHRKGKEIVLWHSLHV